MLEIAILALFSGLIAKIKFLILKIFRIKLIPAVESITLLKEDDFESNYDYVDDDDDTFSSLSSDEEEEIEELYGEDYSVVDGSGGGSPGRTLVPEKA